MGLEKATELSWKFLHKNLGRWVNQSWRCNAEFMVKPETKFWHELKRNTPQITWTRLENSSVFGTPDLLGYNKNQHFFTGEVKVIRGRKIRVSPHQIAFHKLHPKNSFILAKHLASSRVKLYEGKKIMELGACGLKLDACCLGLEACGLRLSSLGAWSL